MSYFFRNFLTNQASWRYSYNYMAIAIAAGSAAALANPESFQQIKRQMTPFVPFVGMR